MATAMRISLSAGRLAKWHMPQGVRLFLLPFQPAFGAIDPQPQRVFIARCHLTGPQHAARTTDIPQHDVGIVVHLAPGVPNFEQAVRAQGGESENPALSQYACDLGKYLARVIDPGQQQVCKYNIDTLVIERQGSSSRLDI